jgi:hypothetical protein
MKKKSLILIMLAIVLTTISSRAQFKDWGNKVGLRGSILFPQNEFANLGFSGNDDFSFDWFKFSSLGEAFLGIRASKALELQLTLGYGYYTGKA